VRLFVALDVPEKVRQEIGEAVAPLQKACPNARWVRLESMHITLKFIGHVPDEKLDSIGAALQPIRSDGPVEMEFRGLGLFPNEKCPRVLWCGVESSANLAKLAADVETALEPLGIAREMRGFVPHLTLARINQEKIPPARIEKLVKAANEVEITDFGSARESNFYLYESVLKHSGAEYKRLQTVPFLKGSV
jgi:2'-5' RNA ligase